jgi:hypothetical protein
MVGDSLDEEDEDGRSVENGGDQTHRNMSHTQKHQSLSDTHDAYPQQN